MGKAVLFRLFFIIAAMVVLSAVIVRSAGRKSPSTKSGANAVRGPDPRIALADCLREKGAVLYSAWWCGPCKWQHEQFGPEADAHLRTIQCSPPNEQYFVAECRGMGVPQWRAPGGRELQGAQDLGDLAEWAGCPYQK